jgi:PKHD-type hydroxylase
VYHMIELLSGGDLLAIHQHLHSAQFADGILTAGHHARKVKHNLQAIDFDNSEAAGLVRQRIGASAKLKLAALPRQLSALMLSRYEPGMEYGAHVDNALMNGGQLRTDLAFTLFLSDPDSYQGGELSIRSGDIERGFKLQAGTMLLYPGNTLHKVKPVTSGVRNVVVGWIQSIVRDPQKRTILSDLTTAQASVFASEGTGDTHDRISASVTSLLHLWAEN